MRHAVSHMLNRLIDIVWNAYLRHRSASVGPLDQSKGRAAITVLGMSHAGDVDQKNILHRTRIRYMQVTKGKNRGINSFQVGLELLFRHGGVEVLVQSLWIGMNDQDTLPRLSRHG